MGGMLAPRITLRSLFALTAVCAVGFLVMTMAVRGQIWALGLSVVLGTYLMAGFVYAGGYLFVRTVSQLSHGARRPFDAPPPESQGPSQQGPSQQGRLQLGRLPPPNLPRAKP